MASYAQIAQDTITRTREDGATRSWRFTFEKRDGSAKAYSVPLSGEVIVKGGDRSDPANKPFKASEGIFTLRGEDEPLIDEILAAGKKGIRVKIEDTEAGNTEFFGFVLPALTKKELYGAITEVTVRCYDGWPLLSEEDLQSSVAIDTLHEMAERIATVRELPMALDLFSSLRHDGQAASDPIPNWIRFSERTAAGPDPDDKSFMDALKSVLSATGWQAFQLNGRLALVDLYERLADPTSLNKLADDGAGGYDNSTVDIQVTLDETNTRRLPEAEQLEDVGRYQARFGLFDRDDPEWTDPSPVDMDEGFENDWELSHGLAIEGDIIQLTLDGHFRNRVAVDGSLVGGTTKYARLEARDIFTGVTYYGNEDGTWTDSIKYFTSTWGFEQGAADQTEDFFDTVLMEALPAGVIAELFVVIMCDTNVISGDENDAGLETNTEEIDLTFDHIQDAKLTHVFQALAADTGGQSLASNFFMGDQDKFSDGQAFQYSTGAGFSDTDTWVSGLGNGTLGKVLADRMGAVLVGSGELFYAAVRDTTPISLLTSFRIKRNDGSFASGYPVEIVHQLFEGWYLLRIREWFDQVDSVSDFYQAKSGSEAGASEGDSISNPSGPSVPGTGGDHGGLAGLGDYDHPWAVHKDVPGTITAQHTFSPPSAQAAFVLGANAQDQLIPGLNAELWNGAAFSDYLDQAVKTISTPTFAGLTSTALVTATQYRISLSQPRLQYDETDRTDENWESLVSGGSYFIRTANDAFDSFSNAFRLDQDLSVTLFGDLTAVEGDFSGKVDAAQFENQPDVPASTWAYRFQSADKNVFNGSGFWINSSGNPDMRLRDIDGDITALIHSSGVSYIDNGANFGVGLISPDNKVHVSNGGQVGTGSRNAYTAAFGSDTQKVLIGYETADDIGLINAVENGVSFKNIAFPHSNVVIGDTVFSGPEKLRVVGNSRFEGLIEIGSIIRRGSTPALEGEIRLSNTDSIAWRNQQNTNSIHGLSVNASNQLVLGDDTVSITIIAQNAVEFAEDIYPTATFTGNIGLPSRYWLTGRIAELYVPKLVVEEHLSTTGGVFITGIGTVLTADISAGASSINVKDNNLSSGQYIVLYARGNYEKMQVTSAPSGSGPYTYSVTRDVDGSGANAWLAGDGISNRGGTAGFSWIEQYATNSLTTGVATAGPTMIFQVRTGTGANDVAVRGANGNLKGWYGYSTDTYGAAYGDDTAINLTIDPDNGLRIRSVTDELLQAAAGVLSVGDGFEYTVATNTLIAGGWTAGSGAFTGGDATLHSTGYLLLGTGNDIFRADASHATYRLWIGNATAASAPFSVTKAGYLLASAGQVGGGYIDDEGMWGGNATKGSATAWLDWDSQFFALADTTFGNTGIQLQYNAGTPRAHIGTGSLYLQFDGTNILVEAQNASIGAGTGWFGANDILTYSASSVGLAGFTATDEYIYQLGSGLYTIMGIGSLLSNNQPGFFVGEDFDNRINMASVVTTNDYIFEVILAGATLVELGTRKNIIGSGRFDETDFWGGNDSKASATVRLDFDEGDIYYDGMSRTVYSFTAEAATSNNASVNTSTGSYETSTSSVGAESILEQGKVYTKYTHRRNENFLKVTGAHRRAQNIVSGSIEDAEVSTVLYVNSVEVGRSEAGVSGSNNPFTFDADISGLGLTPGTQYNLEVKLYVMVDASAGGGVDMQGFLSRDINITTLTGS